MKQKSDISILVATENDYDHVLGKTIKESGDSWRDVILFAFSLLKRRNIAFYVAAFGTFLWFLGFPLPIVFGCCTGSEV